MGVSSRGRAPSGRTMSLVAGEGGPWAPCVSASPSGGCARRGGVQGLGRGRGLRAVAGDSPASASFSLRAQRMASRAVAPSAVRQAGASPDFDLMQYLGSRAVLVEKALDGSLPAGVAKLPTGLDATSSTYTEGIPPGYPGTAHDSMRYSLLAGGKRLRPVLALAACELVGGTNEDAMALACAVEMIHTMSLMHDDLPAMDNDDFRRGKPTNHVVYGEDIAILAGDALLAYAFEYIARATPATVDPRRVVRVIADVARCVGACGLVGGQVVDLESEGKKFGDVDIATLEYIHVHKTAALLEASVVGGANLGGATDEELDRLQRFSRAIGLAFQIIDDILDVTATTEELGKTAGKDLNADKTTFPKLLGLEASRARADELIQQAKDELLGHSWKNDPTPLLGLADFITARKN